MSNNAKLIELNICGLNNAMNDKSIEKLNVKILNVIIKKKLILSKDKLLTCDNSNIPYQFVHNLLNNNVQQVITL